MNTTLLGNKEELDEQKEKLIDTAKRIEAWRVAHGIAKDKMPNRFKGLLRSYRNIERACADDTSEIDVDKNLAAFESVWSIINTPPPRPAFKPCDDFDLVLELRNAFVRTMTKTGPNRVIIVTAPSGRGKSEGLKALKNMYKARVIIVSASRVWKDKPLAVMSAIWEAMGKTGTLGYGPAAMAKLTSALKENRVCICIDEAHYLGPDQLNTVTTLVNATQGEWILAGQPTLWSKLENDKGAFQEARQLTKNRLSRRIRIEDIAADAPELKKLVERRLPWLATVEDGEPLAKIAADMLGRHAATNGNLGFVRNVIERCQEALEEGAEQNWDTFAAALQEELAGR